MIDTHAHLDALDDPDGAVARARDAGVDRVITVGSGLASCRRSLELAERHDGVFVALGIHPHQAGDGETVEDLRALLASPAAVAVGETGLDYYRDHAPRDDQRRVFSDHLSLAEELRKPVVVHTRAADDDTLELLAPFPGTVVMHCFSSPELLPTALERDYYVSFAGNVTYPKADSLRDAAARVPEKRILAETDCPYLSPQPVRGRRNEPAHVVHTLASLAAARSVDAAALAERIDENARTAFSLP